MKPADIEQLKSIVQDSIKTTVNGKIDKIDAKLDKYIEEDTAWKTTAEPVIKMGEQVQGFSRVSLYIVGFIAAVTGAILGLIKLFKNQ